MTCSCGRPAPGATLCRACTDDLRKLLARVVTLAVDLDVALSRQARTTVAGPSGGGDEQPLPFSLPASDALRRLATLTAAWSPLVPAEGRTRLPTGGSVSARVVAGARLLGRHLDEVRRDPHAQAFLDGLHQAVEAAVVVIDHPAVVLWVGTCEAPLLGGAVCPGDLYARTDDVRVICPVCGAEHDAQAERFGVLIAALEVDLTASQAATAVKAYGVTTTPSRVRFMASDGDLKPVGIDEHEHPTYRLGDVLDALRAPARPRKSRRKATP